MYSGSLGNFKEILVLGFYKKRPYNKELLELGLELASL